MYGGKFAFLFDWASLQLEGNLPFLLCFTLCLRAIFQVKSPGGLIFGGAMKRRVFYVTSLGDFYLEGLIQGGGLFSEFYGIFWQPIPRAGSTVSSSAVKCDPKLLKDSTSCNQMSPLHKCTVFLTFSERRKQNSGFVLAAVHSLRSCPLPLSL